MIEIVSTFSSRLNEALEITQMQAVELSEKTGLSESLISQYRSGTSKPRTDKLALIADALKVNPVWLMGLNVPMDIQVHKGMSLTSTEAEIIEAYRRAIPEVKIALHGMLGIKGAPAECGTEERFSQ